MTTAEQYAARVAAGVCVSCGIRPPARNGVRRCEKCTAACTASNRARAARNRKLGTCVQCGTRPPAPGRKMCYTCLVAARDNFASYRERNPDDPAQAAAARLAERISSGMCTGCGWRHPRTGRKTCQACADAEAERRSRQRAEWIAAGWCPKCRGSNPLAPGRKMCVQCLSEDSARSRMRRSAR